MKILALVLLVGCADEVTCTDYFASDTQNVPASIISGRDRIAIAWETISDVNHSVTNGAFVTSSGGVSSPYPLQGLLDGTLGSSSMLRYTGAGCGGSGVITFALEREATLLPIDVIGRETYSLSVVFDGTAYQVFWHSIGQHFKHRSVSEDGTLGPVDDLLTLNPDDGGCVFAASDGQGTTYAIMKEAWYAFDRSAGSVQYVGNWTRDGTAQDLLPVWFAGEFHVADHAQLISVDPVTHAVRTRAVPESMAAERLLASDSSLFLISGSGVTEVDASLAIKTRHSPHVRGYSRAFVGTTGNDLIYFESLDLDPKSAVPGTLELARVLPIASTWRTTIATDSPPVKKRSCDYPDGENTP